MRKRKVKKGTKREWTLKRAMEDAKVMIERLTDAYKCCHGHLNVKANCHCSCFFRPCTRCPDEGNNFSSLECTTPTPFLSSKRSNMQ